MSGWQINPGTRVWCFYPGGPYYTISCCESQARTGEPLVDDPQSIRLCEKCIKAMKKLVRKLEDRNRDEPRGASGL